MIRKTARPGQGIRPIGQDIRKGDLIIPKNHQIRSSDISALATYGYDHVSVKFVRVGIIPVGNELVPIGTLPNPGQVVESNSVFAASFLSRLGALCTRYEIVPDISREIEKSLYLAISQNDLVLVSSGTSVGRFDNTADSIKHLGKLIFHGVAILPGKPAMLGEIAGKPVMGLPGYPVGSQTVLRELVMPLLVSWGLAPVAEWIIPGRLARNLPSELGMDEYIPVSVSSVNGCFWAFPHPRGSGLQMNLVRANGFLHIPPSSEGLEAGSWTDIHFTSSPHVIERSILCSGVKNPGITLLADIMADNAISMHIIEDVPVRALLTLQKNACNFMALNIPTIDPLPAMFHSMRNLPGIEVHIGQMQMGIISWNGVDMADLGHTRLINPPMASSGRILIDKLLLERHIQSNQICGNSNLIKTENAIVAAVKNGDADAGICSFAVAADSGLIFEPIYSESHDIFIRKESLDDERMLNLLHVVQSEEFQHRLRMEGKYETTNSGQIKDLSSVQDGEVVEMHGP